MVSLDRKLDVLHHSISTFTRWLDHCSVLLETLSAFQTGLESDHDKARSDESQLRDLALQYKDILLQIKDQCSYLQEITGLCKEIRNDAKDEQQMQRHAKANEMVNTLSRHFAVVCATTKQQYTHLSTLLQVSSGAKISPGELRITTPSFSPTPTLTHRITKTPPPSHVPPRPSSAQAHRANAIVSSHYQPVFVKPTTFSLVDREKEEGGGGASGKKAQGLTQSHVHCEADDDDDTSMAKAPVSQKWNSTAMTDQSRPKETTTQTKVKAKLPKLHQNKATTDESKPKDTTSRIKGWVMSPKPQPKETTSRTKGRVMSPKPQQGEATTDQSKPKETTSRTKGRVMSPKPQQGEATTDQSKPKETTSRTKGRVMSPKPQQGEATTDQSKPKETTRQTKGKRKPPKLQTKTDKSDPIPEILSLEGSPVIPGRRSMFRFSSEENLMGLGGSASPEMGQTSDGRESPKLPMFNRGGSPDLWIGRPRSKDAQDGDRVKVLPMAQANDTAKACSPPPVLKPKPNIPKKPLFLKQNTDNRQHQKPLVKKKLSNDRETDKSKPRKNYRFTKLPVFGSGGSSSPKRTGKDSGGVKVEVIEGRTGGGWGREGGKKVREDGRGSGETEREEGREDGRSSPLLQGKRVMLTDESIKLPHGADSAKKKAPPPPVARKPVSLMERITSERNANDQSAKTHRSHLKPVAAINTNSTAAPSVNPLEASGEIHTGNIDTTELAVDEPSHNRASQQLRVHLYKLDTLAGSSVASASIRTTEANTSTASVGDSIVGTRNEAGSLADSDVRLPPQSDGLRYDRLSSAEVGKGVVSDSNLSLPRSKGGEVHDSKNSSKFSLKRSVFAGKAESSNTDTQQDLKLSSDPVTVVGGMESRYDRLGMGLDGMENGGIGTEQWGGEKYDHLSDMSAPQQEVKGQIYETLSEFDPDDDGRDHMEGGVALQDEGRSYYIGGRGRRRESELSQTSVSQGAGREKQTNHITSLDDDVTGDHMTLRGRLRGLSDHLQSHIHTITERDKSSLRSLDLEIHMGEVKAMLALLEVRGCELAQLRTTLSPSSKRKFAPTKNSLAPWGPNFPPEEVKGNRQEIVKLSERIELLEKHCRDSIAQIEEVMEFVLLFESELKVLNDVLANSKERLQRSRELGAQDSEEAWGMLTETLAEVNGQRAKLSSVEQLLNHLLYLEPVFDGDSVRGDMQQLTSEYQRVILEVFSQLEALARVKCEQLLMDMSVICSWTTEAGLAVQALSKRAKQSSGSGDRIAASKESLDSELKRHKYLLLAVTKELEKITSLLSPDDHDSLRELVYHVGQTSKELAQIENGLSSMKFGDARSKVKGNGAKSSSSDYVKMSELEDSLKKLERKHSRVVPPVPVRNVNAAKAKESDYAHIEDLEIHGHSPKVQRKPSLLKPYAQVSMKDPLPSTDSNTSVSHAPPPVPIREGNQKVQYADLKVGQSIRDLPLPPRPDEGILPPPPRLSKGGRNDLPLPPRPNKGGQSGLPLPPRQNEGGPRALDRSPSPSPLPPPPSLGGALYDTLPKQDGATGFSDDDPGTLYDVPRSLRRGETYDIYDIPRSVLQPLQSNSRDQEGEGPVGSHDQPAGSHDLYDVPKSFQEDVYDVPRANHSISPSLYDVPRALREGHSGQGDLGQTDSAQDGQEANRTEVSPEMMYDVPRTLLEPPSPLVEFNQFATRQLDKAINRLPRSPTYRPDLDGLEVELRGKGAGLRPSSLHEDLLQFIIDEWAQIPKESSPPPAEGSHLIIEETARLLEDHTHTEACLGFTRKVGELEEHVKGVMERISNLRVPREPDLEKVHNAIDQCESLFSQMKKLQSSLTKCNERSLVLLSSLSTSPPPPPLPTSLPRPPLPPSARLTQLIEIWLFDLTTILQSASVQLATKLRELREHETLTNKLHGHLQTLNHTLTAATKLVNERDDVIEVRGHLQQCKELYNQLSRQSDWIDQLVAQIQGYASSNPQSQACHNLLEQVQQIERDWRKVCEDLAAAPQLEPTLRANMIRNIAMAIDSMQNDLPGLEVTSLKLDDIVAKQRKARSLVSKSRQILSALQSTEVNLHQTMSPAGNHGSHAAQEVMGGVDHTHQQKQCRELQQECRKVMSELKTLGSLLATSHTLLDRLTNEMRDLQVWLDDTKAILEVEETAGPQQHQVKIQAISQQVLARHDRMESYQSLVSEVLLLPGNEREKKELERQILAVYNDWDTICQQCVPAGTLPLMSPSTPKSKCFQAPQEFEDPLQMVEWLILLESKLQPEKLVVGDYLHVRRALRDVQLIEAELKSKERVYDYFMKDVNTEANNETENQDRENHQPDLASPEPLPTPVIDSMEFNFQQGVNSLERRKRHFRNSAVGMESVQEQSGEEDEEGDGMRTPRVTEQEASDSNKNTLTHGATASQFNWSYERHHSMEPAPKQNQKPGSLPKQPFSLPALLSHASQPHISTPPTSLQDTSTQSSLLSSLSSRSLLSHQISITSSITASLAELLAVGSPTASMPEELYQLMLLWNGIKTAIELKRERLEQTRDQWNSFEGKKEEFVNFLTRAEERLRSFRETLGQAIDMGVIQNQIETQKSFLEEVPAFEQKLPVLNELGKNLATGYDADDSTADVQEVLKDLNQRWTTVMERVSRHQPEVNLLSQQWAEFHSHYQSFNQWLRNMDTEMSNLNPYISNMATVQMQLAKLKEIQEELTAHEGVLDSVKLLSYKLLQREMGGEGGGCHVNPAAIHSKLDSASRRWDSLQKLAKERHSALEESLTEKQQLLTRMADCLSWLQQAEQHMITQKPLGGDYYQIHEQYLAHQTFGQEVEEQVSKMEAVIQAGRSGLLEVHWPIGTPERSRMDSLRGEFAVVERRWTKIKTVSQEWGKLLESLHPEMETFQTLCAECGQRLSEVELRASGIPPIANRVVMLTQQLEELREFEAGLVVVGNVLEKVIGTQTKLVQLGAKVSSDLAELVKRFHERWVEVKKKVTNRYLAIDKAMVKYDPENLGVATLPKGWIREKTRNGTPYYVQNTLEAVQQWQHPELSQLYQRLELQYSQPCYPTVAYPAALKLRALQKKTQLHLLETRIVMETFEEDHHYNIHNSHKSLANADMIMLCLGLYEQADRCRPTVKTEPLYINIAVELTAAWIRDVYDITHEGSVTCVSFQIAMVCLTHGRLEDKQKSLFRLIARDDEFITLQQLADFLEHLIQIPQSVLQTQYCSLDTLDYYAQDCFNKFSDESGEVGQSQFLSWVQSEPLPLAWLAVLHRVIASENTHHDVRCAVCRNGPTIQGFRYRCQQCHNYDMCQECFWSGGTTHGHDRTKHYMEEYCVVRPSGDELKDFFRNLQRHMKRKKKNPSTSTPEVLQEHAPHVIGDSSPTKVPQSGQTEQSPATKQKHTAISVGDGEPYKRLTSPPPQTSGHRGSRAAAAGQRDGVHGARDFDSSLDQLSQEDKNLSETLSTLRQHRQSYSSNVAQPTTRMQNEVDPVVSKPHPPQTSSLHGRVRLLEDQNSKMENYITQLRTFAQQPPQRGAVSNQTNERGRPLHQSQWESNRSPLQQQTSNGSLQASPAHRGSPYAKRERKYHYITVTTENPTHSQSTHGTPTHYSSAGTRQVTTTTGTPSRSRSVPASPAHHQMVLQPPALVRNNKSLTPVTLL